MQKLGEGFSTGFDTPSKGNSKPTKKDTYTKNDTTTDLNQSSITTNEFKTPKQRTPRSSPMSSALSLRSSKSGSAVPLSPARIEELKPKPLRKIATNFFGIIIFLAILFATYYGYTNYQNQVSYPALPYCDSEDFYQKQYPCIACPKFGYCSEGRVLLCEKPHILEGGVCVKNSASVKLNVKIAGFMSDKLQSKAGEYECGTSETKSESLEKIQRVVEDFYGSNNVNFTQVVDLVKSTPQFGLVVEKDQIYSKTAHKTKLCRLKEIYRQNSKALLISVIIMFIVGYLISKVQ
eukprot:gene1833-975_t